MSICRQDNRRSESSREQEARLSPSTLSIGSHHPRSKASRISPVQDNHKESNRSTKQAALCGTFALGRDAQCYCEFLGYSCRHVLCGRTEQAWTARKKPAKWLAEKGYVEETADAQERAQEATRDLPAAHEVLDLLVEYVDCNAPDAYRDTLEDHFSVEKIEPGKLWLEPLTTGDKVIGPVPVPVEVTELCRTFWDIFGAVVKTSRGWRFLEVWNVSP